jgi:hypothetical protein
MNNLFTVSSPDVPAPAPFDPVRVYPHNWLASAYLYALGGSIFSDSGASIWCCQYSSYITATR